MSLTIETLFEFIRNFTANLDELSDGAYWQMHYEAVQLYNQENNTDFDWYDIQGDYINWYNAQQEAEKPEQVQCPKKNFVDLCDTLLSTFCKRCNGKGVQSGATDRVEFTSCRLCQKGKTELWKNSNG